MFCNNCGNYNPEGAQTCSSCGSALNQQPTTSDQNQAYPNNGQSVNYQPYSAPQELYPQQSPYAQPAVPVQQDGKTPGKGAGVASLILGIISLALFCIPVVGLICALIGLILGIVSVSKSRKAGKKCGAGIAGIICSAIGLAIGFVYVVAFSAALVDELSSGLY